MAAKRKSRRAFGRIRKLPSGRFQARYPGPDGVLRAADQTFATTTDADRWLARKRIEMEEGRWLDPAEGRTTVRDWSARWLTAVSPQLKHKTQASYRSLINSLIVPALGDRELSSLRPITIVEWVGAMKTRGLSASRIRQAYRVLSQVMRAAVDNEMIGQTPCRGVKLPRMPQTEPHILTPLEASRIVRSATKPHDLLISLLAYAGLRVGEAFALRRADIDVSGGLVLVDENLAEANGTLVFDTPSPIRSGSCGSGRHSRRGSAGTWRRCPAGRTPSSSSRPAASPCATTSGVRPTSTLRWRRPGSPTSRRTISAPRTAHGSLTGTG